MVLYFIMVFSYKNTYLTLSKSVIITCVYSKTILTDNNNYQTQHALKSIFKDFANCCLCIDVVYYFYIYKKCCIKKT